MVETLKCWNCCGWLPNHIVTITDVRWRHLIGLCVQCESRKRNFTLGIKTLDLYCRVFNFFLVAELFLNQLCDWVEILLFFLFFFSSAVLHHIDHLWQCYRCWVLWMYALFCVSNRKILQRSCTSRKKNLHRYVRESQETDVQITPLKNRGNSHHFFLSYMSPIAL